MANIRLAILITCLIGLLAWGILAVRSRQVLILFGVGIWLFNVAAFHTARLLGIGFEMVFLNNWSIGIHLHGAITLAGVGIFLLTARVKDA